MEDDNENAEIDDENDVTATATATATTTKASNRTNHDQRRVQLVNEAEFSDSSPIIGKQNFSSKIHSVAPRNSSLAISSRIADSQAMNSLHQHPQQQSQQQQPHLGKNVRMSKEKQKFFRHSAFNSERSQKASPPSSTNLASSANQTGKSAQSHFGFVHMELSKNGLVLIWLETIRTIDDDDGMSSLSLVLCEPRFPHRNIGYLGEFHDWIWKKKPNK